ncbi:MAG TPA: FecR family protein, partial [Blastocatellia bacterium]|nr:FecR family protein [Blastocatellia bacterium]
MENNTAYVPLEPTARGRKYLFGMVLLPIALMLVMVAPTLADDPPGRVGRVSYIRGSVSFQPAGDDEWSDASPNYPVTTGDRLWADRGAEAEIHVGRTAVQLGSRTDLNVLQLNDEITQLSIAQGSLDVRIRQRDNDRIFEVDTPDGAIDLIRPGLYRFDVDTDEGQSRVTVRQGLAEVTSGGEAFNVDRGQQALIYGGDSPSYDIEDAPPDDAFDNWAVSRDRREDQIEREEYVSQQYVSPAMTGYEDLGGYGSWQPSPEYGTVWYPRVAAGWAPYHEGHWAWVAPWGWTWVDDAPWGFAPFHYGRWAFIGGRWGWTPGAYVAAPVYAPALVAFVGIGGPAPYAWFPLGPREVWVPGYRYSPGYLGRVNYWGGGGVTNITNVNVTNVNITNVRYVNRNVPGACVAVSSSTFVHAGHVGGGSAVAVSSSQLVTAHVTGMYPPVVPSRESVRVHPISNSAAIPPAQVLNSRIVTKTQPPPRPVPISSQLAVMQSHPGKPVDPVVLSSLRKTAGPKTAGPTLVSATAVTARGLKARRANIAPTHQPSNITTSTAVGGQSNVKSKVNSSGQSGLQQGSSPNGTSTNPDLSGQGRKAKHNVANNPGGVGQGSNPNGTPAEGSGRVKSKSNISNNRTNTGGQGTGPTTLTPEERHARKVARRNAQNPPPP